MNRERRRETPHTAAQGEGLVGQSVELPNVMPKSRPGGGNTQDARTFIYFDDDNWMDMNPEDPEWMVAGELVRLRSTSICVNGVEKTCKVFRTAVEGEA